MAQRKCLSCKGVFFCSMSVVRDAVRACALAVEMVLSSRPTRVVCPMSLFNSAAHPVDAFIGLAERPGLFSVLPSFCNHSRCSRNLPLRHADGMHDDHDNHLQQPIVDSPRPLDSARLVKVPSTKITWGTLAWWWEMRQPWGRLFFMSGMRTAPP